jgi:hypothetical protein
MNLVEIETKMGKDDIRLIQRRNIIGKIVF